MDLSQINKVSMLTSFLPVKKLSEFTPEKNYRLTDLKKVKTIYGQRISIDMEEHFTSYLLARVVKAFEEDPDLFQQITPAVYNNNFFMQYRGLRYNSLEVEPARETKG